MKAKNLIWLGLFLSVITLLSGCVPKLKAAASPAAPPNFTYTPPSKVPATRSNMSVAIIKPVPSGTFLVEDTRPQGINGAVPGRSKVSVYLDEMLRAAQTDTEEILIAKGFTSAGAFPAIDELTFSQKERASLILVPTFKIDIEVERMAGGGFSMEQTATVRGSVVLEFLEPMSHEKVWMKRLELQPFTKTVQPEPLTFAEMGLPPEQRRDSKIGQVAVVDILNSFYPAAMSKIWDHLDPVEIQALRKDTVRML